MTITLRLNPEIEKAILDLIQEFKVANASRDAMYQQGQREIAEAAAHNRAFIESALLDLSTQGRSKS